MPGHIHISDAANRLYHTVAREIGTGEQAIHIVWALNPDRSGYWRLGFSPEATIHSAPAEIQEWIIAGKCREIMVVVDGPVRKKANEMRIDIDSPDGATFNVSVAE
jgi:hypothetical protein